MARARPLPGIRFEAVAPPAGDVLPRMDIPAFVGFAASGPLDLPVAVEDVVQFERVFGVNLPLVRESDTGAPVEAYLAPAVRAFFRNGGRRCWIVRVAGETDTVAGTPLERGGLARFDAGLFLDPDLRDANVRDLLDRADFIRYQSSEARPLRGIHAALGIEEVTLIAVPDAVHRGWLQEKATGIASPLASSPLAHPEWWRWLDCNNPNPQPPAAGAPLGGGGFIDHDVIEPVAAPLLAATAPKGGTYDLFWPVAAGATDVLQEATRPDFSDAADIATSATGQVTIHARAAGDLYYRVRRLSGARTSDWSNGVAVRIESAADWTSVPPRDYDDSTLVAVHNALVTMCAARGDLVAILSLPMHYDERQAIAHPARLALESHVRSYGALWHPWLILRDGRDGDAAPLKATPPDGATAGVLAARALARGAWIAPANEPLRGPVALTPSISAALRQALQDAAVNVIRQEPTGFVCLDADTLSPDDEVRPLNVRRLIALVRRAALRVGEAYVFEPNDGAARRAVRRAFESILETLFFRGAFAGRTEQTSFQVVTDESLNTPRSIDAGRLIAEIRIAPSRPLSFLTIRLLQAGGATVVQEART
jgi:phage tail sheath protein FI